MSHHSSHRGNFEIDEIVLRKEAGYARKLSTLMSRAYSRSLQSQLNSAVGIRNLLV